MNIDEIFPKPSAIFINKGKDEPTPTLPGRKQYSKNTEGTTESFSSIGVFRCNTEWKKPGVRCLSPFV